MSSRSSDAGAGERAEDEGFARKKALAEGIAAVMSAMSSDVRFTNENEAAFALLRRGCRYCAGGRHSSALEALRQVPHEQQATVVDFLVRFAISRRGSARRVQELGAILVGCSPSWVELLTASPLGGPKGLLAEELSVRGHTLGLASEISLVPPHESRIFLRERLSKRFLSITHVDDYDCCAMTDRATSLFVCHWVGKGCEGSSAWEPGSQGEEPCADSSPDVGFAHEGVPALGCFLGCRRRWADHDWEVCCASRNFGKREHFRWGTDTSLQHRSSGLWLWVESDQVLLHTEKKSFWEVLEAI